MANNNSTALPELELFDIHAARAFVGGVSRNHFYQCIRRGQLPKPIKIGVQMSRWLRSELQAAIDARIVARDNAQK